eukprot:2931671-Rhodomonas_salina.3
MRRSESRMLCDARRRGVGGAAATLNDGGVGELQLGCGAGGGIRTQLLADELPQKGELRLRRTATT